MAGVPVDRAAGAAAELAPLFAALAPIERRCEELLADAEADARRIRREAEEEAARLVAVARDRQATERAAVLTELRARRSADAAADADAARRQATEVRALAEARMAGCVADVVAAVRSLVAAP